MAGTKHLLLLLCKCCNLKPIESICSLTVFSLALLRRAMTEVCTVSSSETVDFYYDKLLATPTNVAINELSSMHIFIYTN